MPDDTVKKGTQILAKQVPLLKEALRLRIESAQELLKAYEEMYEQEGEAVAAGALFYGVALAEPMVVSGVEIAFKQAQAALNAAGVTREAMRAEGHEFPEDDDPGAEDFVNDDIDEPQFITQPWGKA